MFLHKKSESGQSLFEALLALGVFAMAIAAIAHLFLAAHYSVAYSVEKSQAVFLAREGIEAVRSMRDADFNNMEAKTNDGIYLVANNWQFKGEPDTTEKFTRTINIIVSPRDLEAWQIESTVTWTSVTGKEAEVSFIEDLTDWRVPQYALLFTVSPEGAGTAEDLTGGPHEEGAIVSIIAAPALGWVFNIWTTADGGTFGNPNLAETTYTMPGNAATVTANFISE